jgi:hypothetical protein
VSATIVGSVAILWRSAVKNVEIASSHDELKAFVRPKKRAGRPNLDIERHGLTWL